VCDPGPVGICAAGPDSAPLSDQPRNDVNGPADPDDAPLMAAAILEATGAVAHGDVPVGAVVVVDGRVVASRHNERERTGDPLAHAEILAIRDAWAAAPDGLARATLYVTLEPCVMCAGAIRGAAIGSVVFGAPDPRAGGCGSRYDVLTDARFGAGPLVRSGVRADEAAGLLSAFFQSRRAGRAPTASISVRSHE
jgi:tRNA(adenine34) deaminase